MKRLLSLVALFATLQASAQQVNPVPDYVFRNQMSVGRGTVTDTAAYFSIGPRYGANKGFMPPIVGDTATFSSGKRNGLLIFSVQKNKFLYWDSVRVQWSDMAGSSGTYITGTGITGYIPQFNGTTTIDTSGLFTLGNRLGIGTSTFAYTSTSTANVELNGTSGGILGFKRNDSARGYLWHTGDNMELANTTAGAISFNTNSATRGSISSAGVWRLHNLAGTGDRVVVASSNGTLSASTSVTGLVDTTTISTRAWRQKGDDSLGAIIATKGTGTVTSVATGYGLSGGTITTTGTLLVDTLNIATRAWRQKGLDSLAALEVSGSGTTNYVPKFTAASTIGNSQIFDNGTNVGIGTASPSSLLTLSKMGAGTIGPNLRIHNTSARQIGNTARISFAPNADYTGTTTAAYIDVIDTEGIPANPTAMAFGVGMGGSPTERLRITSGGNVGIGDASPTDLLVVNGRMRVNGTNRITFGNNSGGYAGIGITGATTGNLTFNTFDGTSDGERLRIFANGRVGVNTTTDAGYQFDVAGTMRATGQIRSDANFLANSAAPTFNATLNTADAQRILMYMSGTDGIIQVTRAGGTAPNLVFSTEGGEKMRIASGGNVGIGTASPAAKLDIAYSTNPTTATPHILLTTGGSSKQAAITAESFAVSGLVFSVGDGTLVDRMTILRSNGNVGIGTTSPSAKLLVNTSGSEHVALGSLSSIPTGRTMILQTSTTGGTIETYQSTTASYLNTYINPNGGELNVATTTDAGDYKLQVAGNIYSSGTAPSMFIDGSTQSTLYFSTTNTALYNTDSDIGLVFFVNGANQAKISTAGELLLNSTGTDAGDYKLQVSGNALVTAGKLDITTNTAFGLSVSRSGTSVVGGQINNSNGILYYGAESSTGGGLFTGSSAYAAVIGSGAAYPLQFATNNVVRASINADGEMLIGGSDVGLYNLQVTGNAYTQTFQYVGSVLGINTGTYNSAGTAQITMKNGTNPDGSVTDQFILYSADVVAGNAAPHFRTENGGIIKLYQETTAVGAATFTANSGTAVNDASTFDGYTLKQIVKALRNQGILQ